MIYDTDMYLNFNVQAMSKFIATSRQATELDKTRLLLENRIKEVKEESKVWAEVAAKAKEEAKGLKNLNEELKTDVLKKDTRLDHLQKKNNELSALLERQRRTQLQSSRRPSSLLICWTRTMQLGSRTSGWTLRRTFPTLILVP